MFKPQTYNSLTALRDAYVAEAHSDTVFQDLDVFGYFEGNAYEAQYVYDEISEATYAVAGDCIDEEPVVRLTTPRKYTISHVATCYPDYFRGHHLPTFNLYADGNTTYQDLKDGMLDWQNTDHLTYEVFKTQEDWDLYQDAVELLFQDAEQEGTMQDIFDPRLDIPVTEEDQEEYSCYAWFVIDTEGDEEES